MNVDLETWVILNIKEMFSIQNHFLKFWEILKLCSEQINSGWFIFVPIVRYIFSSKNNTEAYVYEHYNCFDNT